MSMLDDVFNALSDSTRRDILKLLGKGEMTAGEIAGQFSISKPSTSHHLLVLKRAGLATSHREGQYIIYSMKATALSDAVAWINGLPNQTRALV